MGVVVGRILAEQWPWNTVDVVGEPWPYQSMDEANSNGGFDGHRVCLFGKYRWMVIHGMVNRLGRLSLPPLIRIQTLVICPADRGSTPEGIG
jgi:hypothetical protein